MRGGNGGGGARDVLERRALGGAGGGHAARRDSDRGRRLRRAARDDRVQPPARLVQAHPLRRVLAQQPEQHRRERARAGQRRRLGVQYGAQRGQRVRPLEGGVALHGQVQGHAQRPQVRLRHGLAARGPLRRHERGRADEDAGPGDGRLVLGGGDTEVGQHRPAVLGEQHVVRLDVAVQDAGRVRGAQRLQQLQADLRHPGRGQRPLLAHQLAQRPRPDELHDDPRVAAFLQHVVDGRHAGVRDPARGPRLAEGAHAEHVALRTVEVGRRVDLLDGHVTAENLVVGVPDRTHAALADGPEQPVASTDHYR
ncbi:hypothetical protein GCM10010486_77370 [Nonomuraea roseoviolacea subsp. carminata]